MNHINYDPAIETLELNINLEQEDNIEPTKDERILCNYCQRTFNNGKRCIGMCVADSEY